MGALRVPTPPSATRELFASHGSNSARLLALHDTEGGSPASVVRTLRGKRYGIHWIAGENGAVIRGNPSEEIVYHVGEFNDDAIGIEQCGFASYRRSRWMDNPWQLLNVAWILAWESERHDIPLEHLGPPRGNSWAGRTGVVYHSDLGKAGGGHSDPGAGYPISHVLGMATSIRERGLGKLERARAILHAHGKL